MGWESKTRGSHSFLAVLNSGDAVGVLKKSIPRLTCKFSFMEIALLSSESISVRDVRVKVQDVVGTSAM